MKFADTTVDGGIEILASNDYQAVPVKVAAPSGEGVTTTVVKAGTPLTAAGASTTGSGAVGILLYDVDTAVNPNGTIVQSGPIDSAKAQEHSGVTYAEALATALPGVIFRTNIGVNE